MILGILIAIYGIIQYAMMMRRRYVLIAGVGVGITSTNWAVKFWLAAGSIVVLLWIWRLRDRLHGSRIVVFAFGAGLVGTWLTIAFSILLWHKFAFHN